MENLDPKSFDHALYSGKTQNSMKPARKEYSFRGAQLGGAIREHNRVDSAERHVTGKGKGERYT